MWLLVTTVFASCADLEDEEDEVMISWHRDNESHNAGQNCLGCHRSDGSGEGNFTTAGTVYKPDQTRVYPNVTVKIYHTEKMEQPVERIEVDGKGNFYTTTPVDWEAGLWVSVTSENESRKMPQVITDGSCNNCHKGQDRISIN